MKIGVVAVIGIVFILNSASIGIACTGFTASEGDLVLFGNNEDWYDPDPYIRIHPAEQNKHGRLYIEFGWPPENPRYYVSFTGINDQGLCFDSFLHPTLVPTGSSHKPRFNGDLMEHCMETCSTVEEVLTIFDQYNLDFMADFQYFIVDRFGNSAIIEGDEIIYREGNYQVITNFLQSDPDHGWYPCWRYNIAVNMLENMEELTVEYFTLICEATHQEGAYPTVYSYVNDLQNNIMYLYHYYNYDNVVIIDVNEEISQGEHSYYLPDLFQQEQNQPPEIPERPSGPSTGRVNNEYTYSASTTDPDDDQVLYLFDWDDGTDSGWIGPYNSGETARISHKWNSEGNYEIKVKAKDVYGEETDWSDPLEVQVTDLDNNRPDKPLTPSGPSNGKSGEEYTYTTSTTDPDGDNVYYLFDWDDGTDSGWLGPNESGEECHASHSWISQGAYNIRVKAKDVYNAESDWSDPLPVSMPKVKQVYFPAINWLFEKLFNIFPILSSIFWRCYLR